MVNIGLSVVASVGLTLEQANAGANTGVVCTSTTTGTESRIFVEGRGYFRDMARGRLSGDSDGYVKVLAQVRRCFSIHLPRTCPSYTSTQYTLSIYPLIHPLNTRSQRTHLIYPLTHPLTYFCSRLSTIDPNTWSTYIPCNHWGSYHWRRGQ